MDASISFTGEQTDSKGLIYLRARVYDPSMGVFTALDSIAGFVGEDAANLGFSYAGRNLHSNMPARHISVWHPDSNIWFNWFHDDFTAKLDGGHIGSQETYRLYNLSERYIPLGSS